MRGDVTYSVVLATGVVVLLSIHPVQSLRCVDCNVSERSECRNGSEAAENDQLLVTCQTAQPYCQVTQTERHGRDGTTRILEIVRDCATEEKSSCENRTDTNLRQCVATCRGDLCNVYNNVADRALNPEDHRGPDAGGGEALAWYYWLLIAVAAVVLIVAAVLGGLRLKRSKHTLKPYA